MDGEYKTLSDKSIESNILFFGQDDCPPNYFFKGNNVRKNYVIHYIQKGKGSFASANHHVVELKAGDIFILPKGVPCFYQADGHEPWSYFWIGLSGTKIATMLSATCLSTKYYLRNIDGSKSQSSLFALYDAIHEPSSLANDINIESLIYQMFYHLIREFPAKNLSRTNQTNKKLKLAITYLEDNFRNSNCTIIGVSHKLNLSRSYLYNLFKKSMNLSPQQFLIKLRMEEAKQYLINSDNTIKEISAAVGYTDEFTFSKAFKRYSGFSPKIFKKNNQN
ncbi:AraC family transcriptional regulator [Lactobacillus sp. PSON]|uniref:AraC family transcriptional regulator n=1 Tax=Lactobacillus sp. PSON TaxID=3455454 RepID=UPI004041BFBB